MDRKTKAPTRRVINTADEDVWSRLEREAEEESYGADGFSMLKKKEPPKKKRKRRRRKRRKAVTAQKERARNASDIRARHQKNQKAQRMFRARVRALMAFIAVVIIIVAVVLLTPIFDVRSITVRGNSLVSTEQILGLVGDVQGTNLFLASKSGMEKQVKTINYIDEVEIKKSTIPPSIEVAVTEYVPSGYVQTGGQYLILDSNLHIIDEAGSFNVDSVPCVIGMKVQKSEIGSALIPESEETGKAVRTFLGVMLSCGESDNVVSADFSNMNNITLNYDNRIAVLCGSQLDFERKLRLFCEAVNNENIGSDARGTIEFNEKGEAIYTP